MLKRDRRKPSVVTIWFESSLETKFTPVRIGRVSSVEAEKIRRGSISFKNAVFIFCFSEEIWEGKGKPSKEKRGNSPFVFSWVIIIDFSRISTSMFPGDKKERNSLTFFGSIIILNWWSRSYKTEVGSLAQFLLFAPLWVINEEFNKIHYFNFHG